jgi:DedD protein
MANGAGFAVQLAAFSDDKGANALAGKLRRAGYEAYTEPLKTGKGTLWRVRVGPYSSREAATAARDKLKGQGQNGIVAAAH